ncbi:MAG TPA: hypothetical protein VMU94_11015 [Streptosporangiaceae bacterium]|nr:hypothetical protein [Streptosporangiaceae bacterium]
MTASTAHLTIRGDGLTGVDVSLRLTPGSFIRCCLYQDRPPILTLDDGPVHVSVSAPDPEHITDDDLAAARDLAAAVTTYLSDLEHHHAAQTSGQAA